jgi:hypothetical protein
MRSHTMSEVTKKKPYTAPQISRVELNHEQAILTTCSITYANTSSGGFSNTCRAGGCKTKGLFGDNAGRAS